MGFNSSLFKKNLWVVLFLLISLTGFCQKWVADTIVIGLGRCADVRRLNFDITRAVDHRKIFPEFISVYERKKWLFLPVDQIVITPHPIASCMENKFRSDLFYATDYVVDIHEFNISNSTFFWRRNYTLFATLELSSVSYNQDSSFIGTFYYECNYSQKRKENISSGYEELIDRWSKQFENDLICVEKNFDKNFHDLFYYYRPGHSAKRKNFYVASNFFIGSHFWGLEGELWFAEPEGQRLFKRNSEVMRFVNHDDFQAIAMGRTVRHLNYRLNDKLLLTNKFTFLIGVNRWKDMDVVSHKLEEILFFDFSMSQRINFNPIDQSGIVFGLGTMEDLYYVVYHKVKFELGLSFSLAYKF